MVTKLLAMGPRIGVKFESHFYCPLAIHLKHLQLDHRANFKTPNSFAEKTNPILQIAWSNGLCQNYFWTQSLDAKLFKSYFCHSLSPSWVGQWKCHSGLWHSGDWKLTLDTFWVFSSHPSLRPKDKTVLLERLQADEFTIVDREQLASVFSSPGHESW